MEKKHRIYSVPFASVYPYYIKKAVAKGRTKAEVDEIIGWLTGYRGAKFEKILKDEVDFETFYTTAKMNPNVKLITGVVCGVRVEEIKDPVMRKLRYLDKLIDELAKGKKMENILRKPPAGDKPVKVVSEKVARRAKAPPAKRKVNRRR